MQSFKPYTMYDISKENEATKKEIEIRGRYLMMCCDIEFSMLNIIMFCHPDPYNHARAGQFKEMYMKNKIDNLIKDIKQFKPEYYIEFKDAFDGLEEFREVRNDMSHCPGRFSDDLNIFTIDFIDKDGNRKDVDNKKEFFKYKEYTTEYIEGSIQRFYTINQKLATLWMRLKMEFESKNSTHPFLHPYSRTS